MTAVDSMQTSHSQAKPTTANRRDMMLWGLTALSAIGISFGLYMALWYAGTDAMQGEVQRIFYIHLPSFFGATLAFLVTVVGGIAYLRTRNVKWDTMAVAGVEVGLMLSLITLATGSIWARPIWNAWWTWDPRLTSAAIMALTYAAYLMLRAGMEAPDKRRLFASVYGILAFATVFFTIIVIRIRPDTIHPAVIGESPTNAEGGFAMTTGIGNALMTNFIVWVAIVTPTLLWWRVRLENLLERVEQTKAEILSR